MEDRTLLIFFAFFVIGVFLLSDFNISGKATVDVSHRFCSDSDNGIKPYTPGYVKSDIGTFNDRCFDNLNQIREYSCEEGAHGGRYQVGSRVVNCGSGYRCVRDVAKNADACMRSKQ